MAGKLTCFPEVYSPGSDSEPEDTNTHISNDGVQRAEEKGSGQSSHCSEGFIPMQDLSLEHLPANCRSDENLRLIQETGKRAAVICNYKPSDQRPDSCQVTASLLKGWGVLLMVKRLLGQRVALVATTRRVLFNEDEVKMSTIEVCMGQGPRSTDKVTGRGVRMMQSNLSDELSLAVFVWSDAAVAEGCSDELEPYSIRGLASSDDKKPGVGEDSSLKSVCIITFRDGDTKLVSFGTVLSEDQAEGSITHDAPTLPSCCGAPMLVFSGGPLASTSGSLWCHVEAETKTGWQLMPDGNLGADAGGAADGGTLEPETEEQARGLQSLLDQFQDDFLRLKAFAAVDGDCLAAFLPVIATFLLQPDSFYDSNRVSQQWEPCSEALVDKDTWTPEDEADVRKALLEISATVPTFVPPESLPETSDITPLLTSPTPCYCKAIVRAVLGGGSGGNPGKGVFLRPDLASREVRPWPWPMSVSRASSHAEDFAGCLTRACLEKCRLTSERQLPLTLLLMIKNANDALHSKMVASSDNEGDIIYRRKAPDNKPSDTETEKVTKDLTKCLGIATLQQKATRLVEADVGWLMKGSVPTLVQQVASQCSLSPPIISFAVGVQRMGHIAQHSALEQPAAALPVQSKLGQQPCHCGRASFADLVEALESIQHAFAQLDALRKGQHFQFPSKKHLPSSDSSQQEEKAGSPGNEAVTAFLEKAAEALVGADAPSSGGKPSQKDSRARLEAFMKRVDALENFSAARDVLSRGATSCEVFLYNCCRFLRQCRMDVQPLWVATPVTVFGRPGDWPGHVTPAQLKDTAWSLLERTFGTSSFGRQRLESLRRDKKKQSLLVDLFVDMKQHKFADQLDPKYFSVSVLRQLVKQQEQWSQSGRQYELPRGNISCHVVLTFAKLLDYPNF